MFTLCALWLDFDGLVVFNVFGCLGLTDSADCRIGLVLGMVVFGFTCVCFVYVWLFAIVLVCWLGVSLILCFLFNLCGFEF